ncbi:hypothetical protein ACIQF6_14760 [Kitasatospora sp. NPDC092948]|uniref:hypothetical protein n=1 Tax=Kitasatospora sp. NPDC092948 TaxID=3364088 RepID=UPI00382265B3
MHRAAAQGGQQRGVVGEVLDQLEDPAGGEGAARQVGQVQAVVLLEVGAQLPAQPLDLDQLDELQASPSCTAFM